MPTNYFINNAGANEKVVSFESWIVWHKLNGAEDFVKNTTAARKEYLDQNNESYREEAGQSRQKKKIRTFSLITSVVTKQSFLSKDGQFGRSSMASQTCYKTRDVQNNTPCKIRILTE